MKEKYPKVLISVLSYNDVESLRRSLDSLRVQTYPNYELMVVDNCSSVEHRKALKEFCRDAIVVENGDNLGYGGGNNVALRYGFRHGFDYVLICNDDIEIARDSLDHLISAASSDEDIGVVGAVEMDDRGTRVVSCGGALLWYLNRMCWKSARGPLTGGLIDAFSAQGAFVLFSRKALERNVFFDESLFLYCDEIDLGYKLRLAGLKARIHTGVYYLHRSGGNRISRGLNARNAYFIARNRVLVAKKYLTGLRYAVFVVLYTLEMFLKVIWRCVASPPGFVRCALLGAYDGMRGKTGNRGLTV